MKKGVKNLTPIVLSLLIAGTVVTGALAQATTEPRQDTAPLTAPMGEKAIQDNKAVNKPVKSMATKTMEKESGVKEESTAESLGKWADKRPSPKAPRGGTHPGQ